MGQAVPGFEVRDLEALMREAGLLVHACRPLPPEPGCKGPALLLATAERSRDGRPHPMDSVKERRT
jgi:ArsR family transcriptional regulator